MQGCAGKLAFNQHASTAEKLDGRNERGWSQFSPVVDNQRPYRQIFADVIVDIVLISIASYAEKES